MEAGCRGGGRVAKFGINRLIVGGVAEQFFDIGRCGHGANLRETGAEAGLVLVELDSALDVMYPCDDSSEGVTKYECVTNFKSRSGDAFIPTLT